MTPWQYERYLHDRKEDGRNEKLHNFINEWKYLILNLNRLNAELIFLKKLDGIKYNFRYELNYHYQNFVDKDYKNKTIENTLKNNDDYYYIKRDFEIIGEGYTDTNEYMLLPSIYEEIKEYPRFIFPDVPKKNNVFDYDNDLIEEPKSSINERKIIRKELKEIKIKVEIYQDEFKKIQLKRKKYFNNLNKEISIGNVKAIRERLLLHIKQNEMFHNLISKYKVIIDLNKNVSLIELSLINFDYKWKTERTYGYSSEEDKELPQKQKEAVLKKFIKFISIRTLFVASQILKNTDIELICINIKQTWFNPSIGNEEEGITSSLQVKKEDIININLKKIDFEKSFNHFKGIHTPSLSIPNKIRPIFNLDRDDSRIIKTSDVISELDDNQNLAIMDWEDFEHLVAQLFELEFAYDKSEVNVTQSSRDKGVDAIIFDPNPLKGGKYILQAKRYTNVVGVSAVRDLYGTIMNEGANRGILITTSTYGPDSYEFAKNKPISLVDGANLLNLLHKHNMNFKIDLLEARQLLDKNK